MCIYITFIVRNFKHNFMINVSVIKNGLLDLNLKCFMNLRPVVFYIKGKNQLVNFSKEGVWDCYSIKCDHVNDITDPVY